MGTAALVLGILGLLAFMVDLFGLLFFINLPMSLLALILGARGKRRVDRGERVSGRDVASAGMTLGLVGVVVGVLALMVWVALLVGAGELTRDTAPPPDEQLAALRALGDWLR